MDYVISSENNILQIMKSLYRKAMLLWEPCYLFIKKQKSKSKTKPQILDSYNTDKDTWMKSYIFPLHSRLNQTSQSNGNDFDCLTSATTLQCYITWQYWLINQNSLILR